MHCTIIKPSFPTPLTFTEFSAATGESQGRFRFYICAKRKRSNLNFDILEPVQLQLLDTVITIKFFSKIIQSLFLAKSEIHLM